MFARTQSRLVDFGNRLFEKHGHELQNHQYISQKLRELGRLLVVTKNLPTSLKSISDCVNPLNWEIVLEGVRQVAGYDALLKKYKVPSLALKLGHSLKKCAKIIKISALISGDDDRKKSATDFITLYEDDWNDRVSNHSLDTLEKKRYNQTL